MAKFIVTEKFGTEYEVKLHPETKDKIVKIGIWSAAAAIAAVGLNYIKKDNERIRNEAPQE